MCLEFSESSIYKGTFSVSDLWNLIHFVANYPSRDLATQKGSL